MPVKLFDADGTEVEAFAKDEFEAARKTAEERESELAKVKEQLSKLEAKDHNFKKLRDMTEAEREKLTATEMELKKRQEALEEETVSFRQGVIRSHMDDALAVLAGDDEDLRKKVLHHYERIKDEAVTREQIQAKMRDAWKLAGEKPNGNPLARAMGIGGSAPAPKKKAEITDDVRDLASKLGIKPEELK